jgi:predicted nucleotidyltransferase
MTVGEAAEPGDVMTELIDRLVPVFQPEEIYLFGSRARDKAKPDSDYDVLLVIRESDEPSYRRAQRAYGALWGLGAPVDVLVVFTREELDRQARAVASLPATVRREGRLVDAA